MLEQGSGVQDLFVLRTLILNDKDGQCPPWSMFALGQFRPI